MNDKNDKPCDRCGGLPERGTIHLTITPVGGAGGDAVTTREICRPCADSLVRWIERGSGGRDRRASRPRRPSKNRSRGEQGRRRRKALVFAVQVAFLLLAGLVFFRMLARFDVPRAE